MAARRDRLPNEAEEEQASLLAPQAHNFQYPPPVAPQYWAQPQQFVYGPPPSAFPAQGAQQQPATHAGHYSYVLANVQHAPQQPSAAPAPAAAQAAPQQRQEDPRLRLCARIKNWLAESREFAVAHRPLFRQASLFWMLPFALYMCQAMIWSCYAYLPLIAERASRNPDTEPTVEDLLPPIDYRFYGLVCTPLAFLVLMSAPMRAAYFIPVFKRMRGEEVRVEDLFAGVRFTGRLAGLAILEIATVGGAAYAVFAKGYLLLPVAAALYVKNVPLGFAVVPLIVDRDMSLCAAIAASARGLHRHARVVLAMAAARAALLLGPLVPAFLGYALMQAASAVPEGEDFSAALQGGLLVAGLVCAVGGLVAVLRARAHLAGLLYMRAFAYRDLFGLATRPAPADPAAPASAV